MLDPKGEKGNLDLYDIEIVHVCSKVEFKKIRKVSSIIGYPSSLVKWD